MGERRLGVVTCRLPALAYCFILVSMRSVSILLLCLALEGAWAQAGKPAPLIEADDYLRKGIAAQQRSDLNAAIEDYRKALAIDPKLAEARANLGAALSAAGQFDAAIAGGHQGSGTSAPDKTAVRMNLGLAYYKKGDMENAHTAFEAVHAARPQDVAAAVLLGYTDIKLQKSNDAATMLTPLENGRENNMDLEYVLAFALIDSGEETAGSAAHGKSSQGDAFSRRVLYRGVGAAASPRVPRSASRSGCGHRSPRQRFRGLYTMAGQARDALGDTEAAQPAFEEALKAESARTSPQTSTSGTMRLEAARPRQLRDHARTCAATAAAISPWRDCRWPSSMG